MPPPYGGVGTISRSVSTASGLRHWDLNDHW